MIWKVRGLKLRTFIALTLPEASRQFLSDCVLVLRKAGIDASFTKPSNFHLTIKFLGDTEESLVPQIIRKLDSLNMDPMPFTLTKPGVFPRMSNPRVAWYGVDSENLAQLANDVDQITNSFGFDLEEKAFVGHLTLARFKNSKIVNLEQFFQNLPKPPQNQHFVSIELIKSELNPAGSIYTPLWQRKLEGEI